MLNISYVLFSDSKVEFLISNLLGQDIGNSIVVDALKGKNIQTIETDRLTRGIYIIRVKTEAGINNFRFIKD